MSKVISDPFNFSIPVDRHGTWCTQWDYVQDRFGVADLTPFTISDMDFKIAPCIEKALTQRIEHGVLGYSRWQHEDYFGAIRHWYQAQFHTNIDTSTTVYGPSVIYMVAKLINLWSNVDDNIVIHTPGYDAFYKVIDGNQRQVLESPLIKRGNQWFGDMDHLESLLSQAKTKVLLLCSPHNPTGKVWTEEELITIAELCRKHHVKVISDEIHMDMVWKGKHIPWSKIGTTAWALVTSASKSFNIPALTGAYGFINCGKTRDAYLAQLKNNEGLSSPAVLAVLATISAYRDGLPWLDSLRQYLQNNLQYVADQLNSAFPEINYQLPESTYLAWIDLSSLKIDSQRLQETLIHKEKVAIMPGVTYGKQSKQFLRLNVGCPLSKVEIGVQAIIRALKAQL